MNRHILSKICCGVLLLVMEAHAQVAPKLITGPNQFEFVSAAYFASAGLTNAVITVHFIPGDPSWSGSVNYSTTTGTAITNLDYTPVSGTLYFSGESYLSFGVPIAAQYSVSEKYIGLILTPSLRDAGAVILRGSTLLYIVVPPPPNLDISANPNGTVSISWLDDGTGAVLEKNTGLGTNWTEVGIWPSLVNGRMTVVEPLSASMALYRLHRVQ